MVIECAFGRLKARFGALRRPMDINLNELPLVIYACFVLHNYCEANKDMMDENTVTEVIQQDKDNQPATQTYHRADCMTSEGERVRRGSGGMLKGSGGGCMACLSSENPSAIELVSLSRVTDNLL